MEIEGSVIGKIYHDENLYDEKSYKAGKQEGRKEVVEWIKEHQFEYAFSAISIPWFTYMTKLEEWGIK